MKNRLARKFDFHNNAGMTVPRSKLPAFAQLLRLPNVFTAVADPLAGWFAIGGGAPGWQLPLLVGASACFYTAGVVFNDCFDAVLDAHERPERPLPSGSVSRRTAWTLATVIMLTGLVFAALAGWFAIGIGVFLAGMIFFYNARASRITSLRPFVLGACRFANFLLGMRCAPPRLWWMPAILGAYAGTITFLSRHEAGNATLQTNIKRLLLGIIGVDALLVLVSPYGDWISALLVASLLIPALALSKLLAMT